MISENQVRGMINLAGGTVESSGELPDGSGFMTASFPLRKDHWLYKDDGPENPPMGMRTGYDHPRHKELTEKVTAAARYAIRAATRKGKDEDFDPDAMVQNMLVGLLGYHTSNGLSDMDDGMWNPKPTPPQFK